MEFSNVMTKKERRWGWCYVAVQMLALPELLRLVSQALPAPLSVLQTNVLIFAINFLATAIIYHKFLLQNAKQLGRRPGAAAVGLLAGFAIYIVGNFVMLRLIYGIMPEYGNFNDATIQGMAQQNFGLMLLSTVVLAPLAEEVLYRGLVFGSLREKSRLLGYSVSVLVFAAIHVVGYIGQMDAGMLALSLLQYVPAGIALAFAYDYSGSIWISVALHMAVNAIGMSLMR